jgi:hypothetical protein
MALQFSIFFPVRIGASIRVYVIRFGCDASIPCEVVFHTCSVIHRMQVGFPFANCCCFLWYTQVLFRSTMLFVQFRSAFNLLEHPFLITMGEHVYFVHVRCPCRSFLVNLQSDMYFFYTATISLSHYHNRNCEVTVVTWPARYLVLVYSGQNCQFEAYFSHTRS